MAELNPYSPPSSVVTNEEGETVLATRGERFGGVLVDGIVLALVNLPIMYVTGYFEKAMQGTTSIGDTIIYSVMSIIIYLLLNGYLLANYGQTIGKRVVGTKIVSYQDENLLPLWKLMVYRFLPIQVVSLIPIVGGFFSLADALFIFRGDKRCIHDHIAGTKVIQVASS